MADQNATLELEQKLDLSASDLETVFEVLKPAAVKNKHNPRDYYDTQDLELFERKVAFRIQHKEKTGYEQTIKALASEDSGIDALLRHEWEFQIKSNRPDFSAITDKQAFQAVAGVDEMKLEHLFTADVKRRFFNLDVDTPEGKAVVEMAFDRGEIRLSPESQKTYGDVPATEICEIEVELVSGPAKAVDIVTEQIQSLAPKAVISKESKNERGISLFQTARAAYKNKKPA